MSNRRERRDLLAGTWPAATPASRDDIRDELEDHLACSAAELAAAGLDPQQADQRARAAFGDVEAVARRLYWLHHGRRIMIHRIVLGGLAGVCVILAIVMYVTYRQSAATAGAVASLKTALEQTTQVDMPVRIVLKAADGAPLAGREVYVWPRAIDGPPFALPDMWLLSTPQGDEQRVQVTLPAAYELLVTDALGVVNLGRRPAGTYTAAVGLQPELLAGHWLDERTLQMMWNSKAPVAPSWVGFAQLAFDLQPGRAPIEVAFRLPPLERTAVRLLPPIGVEKIHAVQPLWLAIHGRAGELTTWLRGFERTAAIVEDGAELQLPVPGSARMYLAYLEWRAYTAGAGKTPGTTAGREFPMTMQFAIPTATDGKPPEIRLKDVRPASQP